MFPLLDCWMKRAVVAGAFTESLFCTAVKSCSCQQRPCSRNNGQKPLATIANEMARVLYQQVGLNSPARLWWNTCLYSQLLGRLKQPMQLSKPLSQNKIQRSGAVAWW
jgi:hypothetical protein